MCSFSTVAVIAIPLRRPSVIEFLEGRTAEPRGAKLRILGQRPTRTARTAWASRLEQSTAPTIADLLAIEDPHGYFISTHTDRLVPEHFLRHQGFLTQNLGGWSPVYFSVAELPDPLPEDPVFAQLEVLKTYGEAIDMVGARAAMVRQRLAEEMGATVPTVAAAVARTEALRGAHNHTPDAHVRALHRALTGAAPITTKDGDPVPDLLLADALMDRLVEVEQARRAAQARQDADAQQRLHHLQGQWEADLDLSLILKGEYIAGRHRRSTIVIAEQLGVVIKQPAPEPYHEIKMAARTFDGASENWPALTKGGAVVMPQGRIRRVLEEGVVPRLHRAFDHGVRFSSIFGLIVEDFVPGPTMQAWVQEDPRRMTATLYERILATQQACELLEVDNPDWHSANFIVEEEHATDDLSLVHIDWGAARKLTDSEQTPEARQARRDQVQNLAFSFHDDAIAARVRDLHKALRTDEAAQARIQQRAEEMIDPAA
ncbi:MAG: hypothetical protein GVY15_10480 [Bacteroidetes bacterium]|jgi:hypothetical protein|nr:hypothetical protein [Bacteroidota bacterium]